MWTSLFGLSAALLGSLIYGPVLLGIYAVWIMFTRLLLTVALRSARSDISGLWPVLLYFNQIYGSLIKIYMLSHLNRQRWTRQKTSFASSASRRGVAIQDFFSKVTLVTSFAVLLAVVGFLTGLYDWAAFQLYTR